MYLYMYMSSASDRYAAVALLYVQCTCTHVTSPGTCSVQRWIHHSGVYQHVERNITRAQIGPCAVHHGAGQYWVTSTSGCHCTFMLLGIAHKHNRTSGPSSKTVITF